MVTVTPKTVYVDSRLQTLLHANLVAPRIAKVTDTIVITTTTKSTSTSSLEPARRVRIRDRAREYRQVAVLPINIPAYASACSGSVKYSSACSCVGVTHSTVTVATPTST